MKLCKVEFSHSTVDIHCQSALVSAEHLQIGLEEMGLHVLILLCVGVSMNGVAVCAIFYRVLNSI